MNLKHYYYYQPEQCQSITWSLHFAFYFSFFSSFFRSSRSHTHTHTHPPSAVVLWALTKCVTKVNSCRLTAEQNEERKNVIICLPKFFKCQTLIQNCCIASDWTVDTRHTHFLNVLCVCRSISPSWMRSRMWLPKGLCVRSVCLDVCNVTEKSNFEHMLCSGRHAGDA